MYCVRKTQYIDDRENVTLVPFKYPRDVLSNRSHFDRSFRNLFDFRFMDFDFVFCHQIKNYTIY